MKKHLPLLLIVLIYKQGMNYKLIVSDYDKTLSTSKRKITARTSNAINEFQANGGTFVLCSARPLNSIEDIIKEINCTAVIANQGATIYDNNKKCIYKNLLSREQTAEITAYFNKFTSHIILLNDEFSVCKKIMLLEKACKKAVNYRLTSVGKDILGYYPEDGIAQVIVGSMSISKLKFIIRMAVGHFKGKYEIGLCDKHLINVTAKGVTKGAAIEIIRKYYDISKEDAIAFGDSQNDVSMFNSVATGVAMANAMKELKKAATYMCESCNNDGLAKYIEQNIL